MEPVSIHLRQLRKSFGPTVAVDDVTLDIQAGELFFLLGPSGCGKTTLLRMLAGFAEPTDGTIRFGERDVTRLPPNKRNTGMMFQGYALWPHMSVAQNVAFGLDVRKVPAAEKNQRVARALDIVQMGKFAQRKINQLSGGQQQRVALARALVIEPTVLLLDEPLSNLDAKLRTEMREQIRDVCKQVGITGVYVTHDQKEALSMADRIAVMREGNVIQVGPPDDLYQRPTSRFVADFLGETNFIAAEVAGRELWPGGEVIVLETAVGQLYAGVYPDDLPTTGNVTCSIRPEAMQLSQGPPPPSGDGSGDGSDAHHRGSHLPARVEHSVYLGEVAQHRITLLGHNGQADGKKPVTAKAYELNPRRAGLNTPRAEDRHDASDALDTPGSPSDAAPPRYVSIAPEDVVILRD